MSGKIRVVIANDYRIFREGLRLLLARDRGIRVVGETVDCPQTIRAVIDLAPDVVLLDLGMAQLNDLSGIRQIKRDTPNTKLLLLTVHPEETMIFRALNLGAKGYISKDAAIAELIKAIRVVNQGEIWVERKMMARFFEWENGHKSNGSTAYAGADPALTPREKEILYCLTGGCSNKEMGETLFISESTVKTHLNNIFKKLNFKRRHEAIQYAIKQENRKIS